MGGTYELVPLVLLLGTPVPPAHPGNGRIRVCGNGTLQLRWPRIRFMWTWLDPLVPVCAVRVVLEAVPGQEKT